MKITIKDIPPSINEFIGNSRNFNYYRKEKQKWHWLIKAAIKEKPPKPIDKAIVHIKYYFPDNRRRDPDNYSGKMILDPLVREGIIADDSFKHIRLVLSAYVDKDRPRTEIEIEDIEKQIIELKKLVTEQAVKANIPIINHITTSF